MACKFIKSSSSGLFQSLLNRTVEELDIVDLFDTPGPNSIRSIPMNGIDNVLKFISVISTENIGSSGTSASNIAFDAWIKNNIVSVDRSTFFNVGIIRSGDFTTTGFDGYYVGNVLTTGGFSYIEFRVDHGDFDYVLTSDASITNTNWHHVWCEYLSGSQEMKIYIDAYSSAASSMKSVNINDAATAISSTAQQISFAGILDEPRLWIGTGSVSSISHLASITAIGLTPEDIISSGVPMNDFIPSTDYLASWWRFETVSATQLFASIPGSIIDNSGYSHSGTPFGFFGTDIIAPDRVIFEGDDVNGVLLNQSTSELDKGGMLAIDNDDDTIKLEFGAENLIKEGFINWEASGSVVNINNESDNIYYGGSGVKINTNSADVGAYIDISNSALLYKDNTYTCSFRYRSISGSNESRVHFILGDTTKTITANTDTETWKPVYITHKLTSGSLSGRLIITSLNDSSLFYIDGLEIHEGDSFVSFIRPSGMRKSGQMFWNITD